jgi:hypothetical protein
MEELDLLVKEINSQNLSPLDCICMLCYFQLWYKVSFDMVHPMPPEIDICESPWKCFLPPLLIGYLFPEILLVHFCFIEFSL